MTQEQLPKIVITGGEGFIGSNLAESLVAKGFEVHSVDNRVQEANRVPGVAYHTEDICDLSALAQVFLRADTVFHMAAMPRVQDTIDHPSETFEVNVGGTQNVLEAARRAKVRRVVFSSSAAIYGDRDEVPYIESMERSPLLSPYAAHKLNGEDLMRMYSRVYGLETVSLRYFNVYGPRLDPNGPYALAVGILLKQRKENRPLTVTGDGLQTRDFIHVFDVVSALKLAMDSTRVGRGEVINIGTGEEAAINGLAALIGGIDYPVEFIPARLEPRKCCASIALAKELLDFEPQISLYAGIGMMRREWGI